VLNAVKKAEDDNALILRFYEWAGKETDVVVHVPASARAASETDLMEHRVADLAVTVGSVTVHTKPYEIKTVKLEFAEDHPRQN
jgi:alpha-mannosidase